MRAWVVGLAVMLAACGRPAPLAEMQPGETGRVVRVIDGDALVLHTGQSVRLIGIEAPALRPRGRDPEPYAVESARLLEDMALGRNVRLHYPGITRDRYDRALAHVTTADGAGPALWLNREMVARGGARVRFYPDTAARTAELLAAETEARDAGQGLWARPAYAIARPAALAPDTRGFMLIAVSLGPARPPEGRYAANQACHRAVAGAALVIEVRRAAASFCDLPEGTARVLRGGVSNGRLDLTLPAHAAPASP